MAEALLANRIGGCPCVHDREGFLLRRVELAVFEAEQPVAGEPWRLHPFLHGGSSIRGVIDRAWRSGPRPPGNVPAGRAGKGLDPRLTPAI